VTAAFDLSARTRHVEIDGHAWSYVEQQGSGPLLFLAPGAVGTGEMFYKLLPLLGGLRVVAVTYPGLSDPRALASGFAKLMDHLAAPSASLLGSSYGGFWAQYFGHAYPQRLKKLVIGNSFIDSTPLHAHPLFDPAQITAATPDELQQGWRAFVAKAPASELREIQLAMLEGRQTAEDLKERLIGVVTAPPAPMVEMPRADIMVLDCEDDGIITPAMRETLHQRYQGAEICTLPLGGHYPHILNSSVLAEKITAFIGR